MVKPEESDINEKSAYNARQQKSLHRLIIVAPLVVAAVFSFGFMQLFSQDSVPILTNNDEGRSQTQALDQLPIVVQPTLPTLDTKIEVVAPPLPNNNPENRFRATENKEYIVGPSSKDSAKALQGVHSSQGNNRNDSLQGSGQKIKLEDAKL